MGGVLVVVLAIVAKKKDQKSKPLLHRPKPKAQSLNPKTPAGSIFKN